MTLPVLDPVRQKTWSPARLVDLSGLPFAAILPSGGRYASRDIVLLGVAWEGRLLEEPTIRTRFVDAFWGAIETSEVVLSLTNADGKLATLHGTDPRGYPVVVRRYDEESGVVVAEFRGLIVSSSWSPGQLHLRCAARDLAVFDESLPKGAIDTATWPLARDVGEPITVVIGTVPRVPLRYIKDDVQNNQYDYLVSRGTVTVSALYRDLANGSLALVNPAEYTVSTVLYAGYTVVRFTTRQTTFSGSFHRLFADVTGLQPERNPAQFAATLLSSPTWGLGLSVNAGSVTAAVAAITAVGGLVCDVAMTTQRAAREWLREVLMIRGMRLDMNAVGEFVLAVDEEQKAIQMVLHDGVDDGERNLISVGELTYPDPGEQVSVLKLRYRPDPDSGEFFHVQQRTVHDRVGVERVIDNACIRDHTCADKTTDYLAKREKYGADRLLDVAVGQEGRTLVGGHLVEVTYRPLGLVRRIMEIRAVDREMSRMVFLLGGWSSSIYQYEAGTLPANETLATVQDNVATPPAAATNFAVVGTELEQGNDGKTAVFAIVEFDTPTTNYSRSVVRSRLGDQTTWGAPSAATTARGVDVRVRVGPFEPGKVYDLTVTTENVIGLPSTGDPIIQDWLAPGDSTAPSISGASIAVRQGGGKIVEIDCSFTEPSDWGDVELYRNTTDDSSTAALISRGKQKRFTDENVVYGTTYYYWFKVRDLTGNVSGFSPSSGHSVTVQEIQSADLGSGAVIETKIGNLEVSTLKIKDGHISKFGSASSASGSLAANTTEQTVLSVDVTLGAAAGNAQATAMLVLRSTENTDTLTVRLKRGSTVLHSVVRELTPPVTPEDEVFVPLLGVTTHAASTTETYTVTVQLQIGGAGFQWAEARLAVVAVMR